MQATNALFSNDVMTNIVNTTITHSDGEWCVSVCLSVNYKSSFNYSFYLFII